MNFIKHKTNERYRSLRVWPATLLCGVMLLWSGCNTDDFLTPEPASFTSTANFYNKPGDFEAGLAAAYDGLRGWASVQDGNFRIATEARSDAINRQFDPNLPGIDDQNVLGWFMQTSNGNGIGFWNEIYQTIYRANIVISRIDDIEWDDAAQRSRILGEAKFIRAVGYYYLIQIYGDVDGSGVPLVLEETTSPAEALDKTLATREAVLNAIVADLQDATSLPNASSAVPGRATSGAANYMLGKTLLLTGDFGGAITALENLDSDYILLPNYMDVFDPGNNYNQESIFELSFPLNVPGQPERSAELVIPHHYRDQGLMNTHFPGVPTQIDGSNNGMYPSFEALQLFDTANDERYLTSFTWTADPSNRGYPEVAHTPTDDGTDFDPGPPVVPASGSDSIATMNKWWWPNDLDQDEMDGNEVIMRYADGVLALAEAHWQRGNATDDADAIGYINQIRGRADLLPTNIGALDTDYPVPAILAGTYLATDDLGRAIFIERTLELLGEGHRMLDLMRFSRYDDGTLGFAQEVLQTSHNLRLANEGELEGQTTITIDEGEIIWPIPPDEIQNSEGDIPQNSFYQ